MTRPKASRYPVSSFGPELLAALLKGAREEVRIPCPDMRTMKFLQSRIHTLRGAMGKENHPQYNLVQRARTSCTWDFSLHPKGKRFPVDAQSCVLTIRPNDAQFTDIINRAGIVVTESTHDLLHDAAIPSTPGDPTVEPTPSPSDPYERFK